MYAIHNTVPIGQVSPPPPLHVPFKVKAQFGYLKISQSFRALKMTFRISTKSISFQYIGTFFRKRRAGAVVQR